MKKDISMNKKVIIGTLMGCLFGATVGYSSSVINVPHTFTAGTSIKASEVNANFSALAQEIANTKDSIGLNKSSDFTETAITPTNAAVGSTVTVGSKSYIIKQVSNVEDPITGKKYTLNYPVQIGAFDGMGVIAANCKGLIDTELAVKVGNGSGFTSYVYYQMFNGANSGASSSASVGIRLQVSSNLCASLGKSDSVADVSSVAATEMINRATELQKYISVQVL